MADNPQVNTNTTAVGATNVTVAGDDIGGVIHQLVKVEFGAADSATQVSAANPLPVVQTGTPALPTGAATETTLSTLNGKIPATVGGSQPCVLRNAAGTAIGSQASATTVEGLLIAAGSTEFYFSTANSSTAQLASAATFTGTIESIINSQAWSVLVATDQNGTLAVREYIDAGGTRVSSVRSFAVVAGSPFSRCFTANGNYFGLTFQNTGGSTTTTLNINVAYGTLPAVTSLGNAPVAINEVSGTAITATASSLAGNEAGLLTRQVPAAVTRCSFAGVGASLITSDMVQVGATGAGMGVSQSGGALLVTTGTTTNSEWLARSVATVKGSHAFRASVVLSQRIVNNNFSVELSDLVGSALAFTNSSATVVTVTFPTGTNPFTSANVGQSLNLSAITTVAGVPGRWPIASASGDTVTFTVAGWPGAGSGTLTLWGWNYHRILFDGTTATNAKYDAQRNGWASGDTTITVNTTASPGTIVHAQSDGSDASCSDSLRASNTAYQFTTRGSRIENLCDATTSLYLWVRSWNGTTAPASTTTFTVGFWELEDLENIKVAISGATRNGVGNSLPVSVQGTPPVTISSGTVTTVSTVTTCSTLTTLANGQTAHSAASTGSPVRVGGRVVSTLDTSLVQGDASDIAVTTGQQVVTKDFASSENDWQFAAAASGIVNTTTAVTIKAAGAASVRNFLTCLSISHDLLGAVTELVVRDGASGTVIFRTKLQTPAIENETFVFPTPLRGTAATLIEVATLTAVTGGVYVNAQGYQSF
jgi:hypothetical protein